MDRIQTIDEPVECDGDQPLDRLSRTGKQYYPPAEIIRMPSGSIVSIPPLKPLNLAQSRFNEAVVFALLVNFGIWGLLAIAIWALFFAAL
ncbi:hypothetical protein IVB34_47580 [Bradyrhizobium sp. 2]|uniref:hypothetical protein n=1 Tax=Bradyrhizobium sp. 2 TaxID=190045 RepID=UPI001FF77535|nr:hypothetical protein [Bradyrhizobium sp. 2]MCK1465752.1 hypothetical protein [Bradyrhizobium sp. 2]